MYAFSLHEPQGEGIHSFFGGVAAVRLRLIGEGGIYPRPRLRHG